jgi:hypothetical protein
MSNRKRNERFLENQNQNLKWNDDAVYAEWKVLVNMTAKELQAFLDDYGDVAGLSRQEAAAQGVRSGRDSARAILRMKAKPKAEWTASDWQWARRQIAFIKRMGGGGSALLQERRDGVLVPTRRYLALLLWGHDPLKPLH